MELAECITVFLVILYLAPIKVVLMAIANRTLCCSSSKLNVLGSSASLECYGMQHSIFIGGYTTEIHKSLDGRPAMVDRKRGI